jgi:hypothetical protein
MKKRYAGEVIYSMEGKPVRKVFLNALLRSRSLDDIHLPTLTVQQTLELALKMKTPGRMLEGVSPKQFREEFLDTLLKMLNISHTKRTLVGSRWNKVATISCEKLIAFSHRRVRPRCFRWRAKASIHRRSLLWTRMCYLLGQLNPRSRRLYRVGLLQIHPNHHRYPENDDFRFTLPSR